MKLIKWLFRKRPATFNKTINSNIYQHEVKLENVQKIEKHTCLDLATACDDCKRRFADFLYEDERWRRIDNVR